MKLRKRQDYLEPVVTKVNEDVVQSISGRLAHAVHGQEAPHLSKVRRLSSWHRIQGVIVLGDIANEEVLTLQNNHSSLGGSGICKVVNKHMLCTLHLGIKASADVIYSSKCAVMLISQCKIITHKVASQFCKGYHAPDSCLSKEQCELLKTWAKLCKRRNWKVTMN